MNLALSLFLVSLIGGAPESWPTFLGQGGTPVDPATIPTQWSPTEHIAWQSKIPGKGQSSPVVFGSKVFVTSIEGRMKEKCHIVCLNLSDGAVLWKYETDSSQKVRSNYFQSRSAPTPAVDSDLVYAFFETGKVVALTHDGRPVWSRSLTDEYGEIESNIGLAASPLLVDDKLVILVDHEGPSYIVALEKKSGAVCWKIDRDSRKSYASPALVPVNQNTHIVCSSDGSIDGYDPADGKRLWSFDDVGGNVHATPLAYQDGHFLVGASPGMHNERETMAKKSNFAMQVVPTASGFEPRILWKNEQSMPSFASPVTYRTEAYWVNRAGVVYCFDAETGKLNYSKRTKQVCWVTPYGLGDHVYLFGKDGTTTVLATGPEFKVVSENQLWAPEKVEADPFGRDREGTRRRGGPSTEGRDSVERPSNEGDGDKVDASEKKPSLKTGATPNAAVPEKPSNHRDSDKKSSNPSVAEEGDKKADPSETADKAAETDRPRRVMTDKEREENRARGENRFPDPVQYGIAVVNGSLIIRTGDVVYCIRH